MAADSAKRKTAGKLARKSVLKAPRKPSQLTSVDHLGPEAIVAFVDNEMSPASAHRARIHIVHCVECRAEIERQRGASERLRKSCEEHIQAPPDLMAHLSNQQRSDCADLDEDCIPHPKPEGVLDKVEMLLLAIKRR